MILSGKPIMNTGQRWGASCVDALHNYFNMLHHSHIPIGGIAIDPINEIGITENGNPIFSIPSFPFG